MKPRELDRAGYQLRQYFYKDGTLNPPPPLAVAKAGSNHKWAKETEIVSTFYRDVRYPYKHDA